ncbi:MAG: AEC family transporter [Bacteroidales bacterium]
MSLGVIFNLILMLVLLIFIGIIASYFKIITPASKDFLARIIFNITLPALVFTNFSKVNVNGHLISNSLLCFLISAVVLFLMLSAGWAGSKLLRMKREEAGIYRVHSMLGNIMYLGFPVISALYGNEGLLYASIFALVSNILMWTVGVVTLSSSVEKSFIKSLSHLLNPNSVAIVAGFILFLLSVKIPSLLLDPLTGLGASTTYLSMIFIGTVIFYAKKDRIFGNIPVYVLSISKLLIVPVLLILIFRLTGSTELLKFDEMVASVIIMQAAMPCMVNVVILTSYLGEDDTFATGNVFVSTVLSLFTIQVVYLLIGILK